MICYLDRTFCECNCINLSCSIKLTTAIETDAAEWWGAPDAPIAISDYSNDCENYIPPGDTPCTFLV